MAIIKDNYVTRGTSGAVGKELVLKIRKKTGETYMTKYPSPSRFKKSKKQAKRRSKFSLAVEFASALINDPSRVHDFEVKRNGYLYNSAIAAFMADKRPLAQILKDPKFAYKLPRDHAKNKRHQKAIAYIKKTGSIGNAEYQRITDVSKPTATRDLHELVKDKIFEFSGTPGAGAYYTLMGSSVK